MRVVKGRLSIREIAICTCVLLFATLAYFSAYYFPARAEISAQKEELKKLSAELAIHQSQVASIAPVVTQGAKTSVPVQRYLAMNDRFSDLITSLNGDGKEFRVNRLSMDKQENKTAYTKSTFSLEIETSFLKLGQFVEALEKSDFLLEINSIDVSRINQELRKCTAKIQLNSYVARKGL